MTHEREGARAGTSSPSGPTRRSPAPSPLHMLARQVGNRAFARLARDPDTLVAPSARGASNYYMPTAPLGPLIGGNPYTTVAPSARGGDDYLDEDADAAEYYADLELDAAEYLAAKAGGGAPAVPSRYVESAPAARPAAVPSRYVESAPAARPAAVPSVAGPAPGGPIPAPPAPYELRSLLGHAHEATTSTDPQAVKENRKFVKDVYKAEMKLLPEMNAGRVAAGLQPVTRLQWLKLTWGWDPEDEQRFIVRKENRLVQYLRTEAERAQYRITPVQGVLVRGENTPVDTSRLSSKFSGPGWGIFVMGPDDRIYLGQHQVGLFHHSSFLAGGQVAGAGELKIVNGQLTGITNKSGHYKPLHTQFMQVLRRLVAGGVDLSQVVAKHFDDAGKVHTGPAADLVRMSEAEFMRRYPAPPPKTS